MVPYRQTTLTGEAEAPELGDANGHGQFQLVARRHPLPALCRVHDGDCRSGDLRGAWRGRAGRASARPASWGCRPPKRCADLRSCDPSERCGSSDWASGRSPARCTPSPARYARVNRTLGRPPGDVELFVSDYAVCTAGNKIIPRRQLSNGESLVAAGEPQPRWR